MRDKPTRMRKKTEGKQTNLHDRFAKLTNRLDALTVIFPAANLRGMPFLQVVSPGTRIVTAVD